MSIYADICCHDCRQRLFLGKTIHENHRPIYFHVSNESEPNWRREQLNQVLWKFLADHTNHRIDVLMVQDVTDEMGDYTAIGSDLGVSFADYLLGWPGLKTGD